LTKQQGYLILGRCPKKGNIMPQQSATPRDEPARHQPRKTTTWGDFLRRLAFWKVTKQEKLDHLFTDAVNELHPEWKRKRQANKAV
jgi:hypothetical protein